MDEEILPEYNWNGWIHQPKFLKCVSRFLGIYVSLFGISSFKQRIRYIKLYRCVCHFWECVQLQCFSSLFVRSILILFIFWHTVNRDGYYKWKVSRRGALERPRGLLPSSKGDLDVVTPPVTAKSERDRDGPFSLCMRHPSSCQSPHGVSAYSNNYFNSIELFIYLLIPYKYYVLALTFTKFI